MAKQSARKPNYTNTPIWHDESTMGIKPDIDERPDATIVSYAHLGGIKESVPKSNASGTGIIAHLNKH